MKKKLFILFCASFLLVLRVFGASPVTLEHTFDGYYFPYNFPTYLNGDDDRYFYEPMISAEDGNISLKTYNEDYTLRDNYNVHFSIPINCEVYTISFSSSLQLADGTPFFIVIFKSTTIDYGKSNYMIGNLYDARNGAIICELGSSSGVIQILGSVYKINDKPSICVLYNNVTPIPNSYGFSNSYLTKVYSLGNPPSGGTLNIEGNKISEPIRTYDINGVLLREPIPGQPHIVVNSDGTSKVMIK